MIEIHKIVNVKQFPIRKYTIKLGYELGHAMCKKGKKYGCPAHNINNVWKPSGYNTELWSFNGYIIFPNFLNQNSISRIQFLFV